MTIEVVGIGLDGAVGLSEKAKKVVDKATVLVGSDRHLNYFSKHRAKKLILGDLVGVFEAIEQDLNNNENIVFLVSGDPLFYGLGRLLLEKISSEKLYFYPHLSSIQVAFNRIKVPWQDAKIISVHGRDLEELMPPLQQGLEKIAILTDKDNNPSAIAQFYLSLNLPVNYDFWICENLESEQEKISYFSQKEVVTLANNSINSFDSLNVVILLRDNNNLREIELKTLPLLGLSDDLFISFSDRPGLMTKREIRFSILGELALKPKQIVWDIGAGTGSVSIEIARLCSTSTIYAIEKTAIGINLIEKNCQRFQVNNVIPLHGVAPDRLIDLPNPDRIFIGGSGGNLIKILEKCQEKLKTEGLIVLAFATLEHLNSGLKWFNDRDWNYRLLQMQISRSVSLAKMTRFSPLNPITLLIASRK
jgi:precorrin-6B C5,15-methyltransferase / cobalt-precorrin-6B C5,C15-methyltransferase